MFRKILVVLVGSLLLSIGINGFLVPHYLLDGGTHWNCSHPSLLF